MSSLKFREETEETQLVFANGFLKAVNEALDDVKRRFFFIGFRLNEANLMKYYETLGYVSIVELAEAEFGLGRSTTYGLIQAYNYAQGGETEMSMADKFNGYGYTQLLEMSKAKTISSNLVTTGIEKILTPKTSVSKIKELRPKWDKYIKDHGKLPACNTVDEFEALVKEEETPAPAPLLEIAEQSEPKEQAGMSVQSIGLTDEEFEAELNEPAAPELTDGELIDYCLKEGFGVGKRGKFEIYDFYYNRQPTRNLFLDFIKTKYGTGGHGGAGEPMYEMSYSPTKGVTIERLSGGKLELPWTYVTGRISRLIECCDYLSPEEQASYIAWKAERDGLKVVVQESAPAPSEEPEEPAKQSKRLSLKNDKARREWLDNFREWGVWFDVPQVDMTFYRFDFANEAALIVEIGYEYWSFSTTPGAKERVSYSIIDEEHPKFNAKGISYTDVITWLTAHAKEI